MPKLCQWNGISPLMANVAGWIRMVISINIRNSELSFGTTTSMDYTVDANAT